MTYLNGGEVEYIAVSSKEKLVIGHFKARFVLRNISIDHKLTINL